MMQRVTQIGVWLCLTWLLAACGGGGSQTPQPPDDPVGEPPPPAILAGFNTLTNAQWDETAVRKVLHVFAYGGQADDSQIRSWANMPPWDAIQQMLTFDAHNLRLSPTAVSDFDGLENRDASMRGLTDFWTSNDPANSIRTDLRPLYAYAPITWYKAAMSRGLNPFRQRIGLFETNYHMSVNQQVGVTNDQIIAYYDTIMNALEQGMPYQQVLAQAALSAAVARQYGHYTNVYINGTCFCNEDFAREYHQLFFGILGEYDTNYHETVAIKNTAAALTDIRLEFDSVTMDFVDSVEFGRLYHTPGPLNILNTQIVGQDAEERITQLSDVAIQHPESLDNLPVLLIAGLADDNLNDTKRDRIRQAWNDMGQKDLLLFLRAYAVSDLFHLGDRVKYLTSIDRQFILANAVSHTNGEANSELYLPFEQLQDEDVLVFSPRYNVFGAQTSVDASESSTVFRSNFNRVTREHFRYRLPGLNDPESTFAKDWATQIPASVTADYRVDGVAEWLWQRLIADGLKNFGVLERAHVYAFLAYDTDLVFAVNRAEIESQGGDSNDLSLYDFDRVISESDLGPGGALESFFNEMAAQSVALDSQDSDIRLSANVRIGSAINFVVATPFMFAQEAR